MSGKAYAVLVVLSCLAGAGVELAYFAIFGPVGELRASIVAVISLIIAMSIFTPTYIILNRKRSGTGGGSGPARRLLLAIVSKTARSIARLLPKDKWLTLGWAEVLAMALGIALITPLVPSSEAVIYIGALMMVPVVEIALMELMDRVKDPDLNSSRAGC